MKIKHVGYLGFSAWLLWVFSIWLNTLNTPSCTGNSAVWYVSLINVFVVVFLPFLCGIAVAQPNNACTGLAPTAAQDGTGEAGASQ